MSVQPSEDSSTFKKRIESLSDLVFGLALSLGSIALIQHIPQIPSDLINDVGLFGFSFVLIIVVWLGYTRVLAIISFEAIGPLVLNLVLLFCVALEPFLYYVLQSASGTYLEFWSSAFALDMGGMMGMLSGLMYLVVRQVRRGDIHKFPSSSIRRFRSLVIGQAIMSALFLASVSDLFWIQIPTLGYLRFLMWYVALGVLVVTRAIAWMPQKEKVSLKDGRN